MTAEQQAREICDLGRAHAREWLKNPCRPLALLRIEYQDRVLDACKWGAEHDPNPAVTAATILEMTAMYGAGIDDVLQEVILLAQAEPQGVLQ